MKKVISLFLAFLLAGSPCLKGRGENIVLSPVSQLSGTVQTGLEAPSKTPESSTLDSIKSGVKKGVVFGLITAFLVGLRPFFVKSLTPDYPLSQILTSYYLYAFILLLIFKVYEVKYLSKNNHIEYGKGIPWSRKIKLIALAMLFGHLASTPIHYTALSMNDATSTEVIHKTTPIFLLIAAALPWIKQEKITRKKLTGIIMVIVGALLVVAVKQKGAEGSNPVLGKVLALISALTFVGSDLVNKIIVRDKVIKNYNYLLIAYGVGAVLILFVSFLLGNSVMPIFNFYIFFLATINVLIWLGKFTAAKWLEASRVRGLVSSSPVATVVIGMFWYWTVPDLFTATVYFIAFSSFYYGLRSLGDQSAKESMSTFAKEEAERPVYIKGQVLPVDARSILQLNAAL